MNSSLPASPSSRSVRLVVVHAEDVLARAAEHRGRVRDARADVGDAVQCQPERGLVRDRRVDRIDRRLRQHVEQRIERRRVEQDRRHAVHRVGGIRIADDPDDHRSGQERVCRGDRRSRTRRAEHLADLERIVAVAAVQRRDRAVVVGDELVVAAEPVDDQARVDVLVVVHALDPVERAVRHRRVEQCDEIAPQQERVVRLVGQAADDIRAVDDQRVDAVVRRAVVEHVDQRVALAGEVHRVPIRIAFAVQVENRANPVRMRALEQRIEQVVVGSSGGGELEVCIEVHVVRGSVHVDVEEVVAAPGRGPW